ncbi:MAG: menaquinol oxidoreductase [Armatimonadetes bacterium]|nr:menaquinol oxidoreductase [Armatimonadota bacterium]
MALVRGTSPLVDATPEDAVSTWPHLLLRGLICALVCLSALLAAAMLFDAPLHDPASAAETPDPAKAPWYLLGLQELVHYSAFIGGVLAPGLSLAGLVMLPYLDRSHARRPRDRRTGICLFTLFLLANLVLILIGAWFRGPGWSWTTPWSANTPGGRP